MADLYLDECIGKTLPALIRRLRHDVRTVDDAKKKGDQDFSQLLYAYQQRRILVTHNIRDFQELHGAWSAWGEDWCGKGKEPAHPGIVGLEQLSPQTLAQVLSTFLASHHYFANMMYRWTQTRGWQTRQGKFWV